MTETYPLLITDDIFTHLAEGCIFTKLDLLQAYLLLPLDDDSKLGLFKYNHLPYGVSVAPAIYQFVMDHILLISAPTV